MHANNLGRKILSFIFVWFVFATLSCNVPRDPVTPDALLSSQQAVSSGREGDSSRIIWGLWDVIIYKDGRSEVTPIRQGSFHLNALQFLEPPVLKGLSISDTVVDVPGNLVKTDVVLTHPFPGMNQFMGFDVRGIVLMPGSQIPFSDPSLIFSGPDEPKLLNPDGLTRWWNPKEFPGTGIFGFKEGLLGKKGGAGVFTATLNGYKYFADGLAPKQKVWEMPANKRGVFSAGASNRRYYEISFGAKQSDFLKFQYAIDASWINPSKPNPESPMDFPISANAPEGCAISVNIVENVMWWLSGIGKGGHVDLEIKVYTWRPSEIKEVIIDAPGITGIPVKATVVPGSGGGPNEPTYSTYTVELLPDALKSSGNKDCLVTVKTDKKYTQDGMTVFFGPSSSRVSLYHRFNILINYIPPVKWKPVATSTLPIQPSTVVADISVVGSGPNQGVYFYGDNYTLYRYPLNYSQPAKPVSQFLGTYGYDQLDIYGAPSSLGRFDMTQWAIFVASSISAAPSPTFLGGLKRDYAFFFYNDFSLSPGQAPIQIGLPDPDFGYFRMVDVCANYKDKIEDSKVFWIQVDDPDEPTPPNPEVTVILGVFQYPFSNNPFSGDIGYLSGSLVPAGAGDGKIDINSLQRFAVDGEPQGVYGSTDNIMWFLETAGPALECFSIVSSDDSGELNQHLCTIKNFGGTPRDIAIFPAHKGGYGSYNWVVVLEELAGKWQLECFNQLGNKINIESTGFPFPGYPANLDVDPKNHQVHVWFSSTPGGPLFAVALGLVIG